LIGRYALYREIAAGGMATVHFGRLLGPVGFSRTVAIKRLRPQFAKDPEFVAMFLDEARLAARIRHPNVVATLDVVATDGELFLVMDYVQGESLARLGRRRIIAPRLVASIVCGALHGLHAAHEARNERGEPLNIVHRDVSPQNILVGVDGTARLLDFGVAKASGRAHNTRDGHIKGKISYMAPEQFRSQVTRQTDIYACAIVAWEALTGQRLFGGGDEMEILAKALAGTAAAPAAASPRERNRWLVPALVVFGLTALGFALRPLWQGASSSPQAVGSSGPSGRLKSSRTAPEGKGFSPPMPLPLEAAVVDPPAPPDPPCPPLDVELEASEAP